MANLQLAVKGEYFDAMIRGEKTEEYRLCNDYWKKRLVNRKHDRLIITKGYPVTNGAIVIHTQRLKSDPGGNLLS